MESPHDVNSPQMRAVYGNRLRLDDPLLGDNPKVAALRKDQSDSSIKVIINEALKKFFFPEPDKDDAESNLDTEVEPQPVPEVPKAPEAPAPSAQPDAKLSALMAMFKMLLDTVFKDKLKG